ncbi:MAG: hypothetical protein A3J28_12365 [Acidobacteria bacterium RIFCSPLOWO2_12_FULL_60_22]|nr:MAG: hypothetical protein A3J28_12365 [Acidobacteria bacterium RIFCSPLOWO2_12_FULL_60_22]
MNALAKSRFFAEPALSSKKQILRGVYPERSQKQILRFAQNDKRMDYTNSENAVILQKIAEEV